MQIAAISVLAFLALWGLVFIAHAALTPARLDRECAKGFNEVIDRHVKEFQAKDAALNEYAKKVAVLEEALSKKHPHDEYLETRVRDALGKLEERERQFIVWLFNNGHANNALIHTAGFTGLPESIINKTGEAHLLYYDPIRPGNGLVEMDRLYDINPKFSPALKDVLYPPRPVTPPQG